MGYKNQYFSNKNQEKLMFWLLQLIVVGGGGRVVLVLLLMFFASEQQKRGKTNIYSNSRSTAPGGHYFNDIYQKDFIRILKGYGWERHPIASGGSGHPIAIGGECIPFAYCKGLIRILYGYLKDLIGIS